MAIERRDIELAIRGKDQATATFQQVRKAVSDLTKAIETQAAGVRSGETALDDLRETYKQLEEAAKSVGRQQGLVDSLRRQTEGLTKFEERANAARAKADAFAKSLEGQGAVSVRAQGRLDALNRTADRTAASFAKQSESVARTTATLERAGVDTKDFDGASKSLLTTAQQIGAVFTTVNTVMSGYTREVKAGKDAERQAADVANAALQRRQAALKAFNDATKERLRLRQALLTAESNVARDENTAAQATQKQTAALNEQAQSVDRLLSSYGRLSSANVQLARTQGRGGAEAAVQAVVSPNSGVRNLSQIASNVNVQARDVQENLGKPVQNYLGLLQDLERSLKNIQNVAKQVDGYQAQRSAVTATLNTYQQARANLRSLNDELKRNPTPENAAAVRAALPAYDRAKAAFIEQLQALRVLREELKQAGVSTRDFAATQRSLVDLTTRTNAAIKDLNRNFDRFGGSRREGAAGLLGLRPYEIQNLTFQINDFFTQLASGASASQAFAQQIGQVAQIQPIWTRLVAFAPLFIALGSAIGVTTAALSRLYQTATSDRSFEAQLRLLSGENTTAGLDALAQRLTRIARRAEELGFAFDDARKSAISFVRDGISPDSLEQSTLAAARLSRVLGIEFAEATRLVSRLLREGRDGLRAFEEAGVGFTESQRRAILEAQGLNNAFERQQAILATITDRLREADRSALSPFTQVAIAAGNAWRGFLDELGRTTVFQVLKAAIDGVANGLVNMRQVGAVVARALTAGFLPVVNLFDGLRRILGSLGVAVDQGPAIVDPAAGGAAGGTPRNGQAGVRPGLTPGQQRARDESLRQEGEFVRDDRNQPIAQRVRLARELAIERFREQFPEALEDDVNAIARLAEIAIRQKIQQELESGSRAGAAAIRRDFQAISQDLQNTVRIRDESIRAIQEEVASGSLSPAQAIERIQAAADQARPAIQRLREEAQRFLDQGRGRDVVRDAAIQNVIASADRQLAGRGGGQAGVNAVLQTSQQEIQRQFQERTNFIQTQNALEQQGVQTRFESEQRIVALYGQTREALLANITAYEEASRAAEQNGQITEAAAAANAAQIQLWRVQLERINPEWARIKQGIENTIGTAGVNFFDGVAQALGDVIAGVTSLEEAWEKAGEAALKFFADVLKGIGQVILQEQVLQLVRFATKSISAGLVHGGGVVGAAGGQRRMVNPAVFAGAPRMHSGGIVGGLKTDERARILQTGEEVLSRDDPRNMMNRNKGASGPTTDVQMSRTVLAVGDDEIANAMNGPAGERVFLNFMRRNAPSVRSLVRG